MPPGRSTPHLCLLWPSPVSTLSPPASSLHPTPHSSASPHSPTPPTLPIAASAPPSCLPLSPPRLVPVTQPVPSVSHLHVPPLRAQPCLGVSCHLCSLMGVSPGVTRVPGEWGSWRGSHPHPPAWGAPWTSCSWAPSTWGTSWVSPRAGAAFVIKTLGQQLIPWPQRPGPRPWLLTAAGPGGHRRLGRSLVVQSVGPSQGMV